LLTVVRFARKGVELVLEVVVAAFAAADVLEELLLELPQPARTSVTPARAMSEIRGTEGVASCFDVRCSERGVRVIA
jgi:hypothetical protein